MVAWTEEERDALPGLKDKAERNGYHECEIVTADDVYRRVPDLGPGALAGLTMPGESIICTWTTNLALATDAVSAALDCCAARVSRVPPSASRLVLRSSAMSLQNDTMAGGRRRVGCGGSWGCYSATIIPS